MAPVGVELPLLFLGEELQFELGRRVLLLDARRLRPQDLLHRRGLLVGPRPELALARLRPRLPSRGEAGEQVLHVALDRLGEGALAIVGDPVERRVGERALHAPERVLLVGLAHGPEPAAPGHGVDPGRGDGEDLVVEPRGLLAVEGEAAEEHDGGLGVVGEHHAGAGEVVVDEALAEQAPEQPLGDAVLEVEVDERLVEGPDVLEDDGPEGARAAPLAEILVATARGAQGVEGVEPGRIGAAAEGELGEGPRQRRAAGVLRVGDGPQGLAAWEQLQRTGDGLAERLLVELEVSLGGAQHLAEHLDLGGELLVALARLLQLLLDDLLLERGGALVVDGSGERRDLAEGDALLEQVGEAPLHHGAQAAQLAADADRLLDQHLQHPVLLALGEDEVVAAHLRSALELPVDAAVALLHAARVPGDVEVEEVGAVVLQVAALAGGVRGDEDAQRVLPRVLVEGALDLLALPVVGDPAVEGLLRSGNAPTRRRRSSLRRRTITGSSSRVLSILTPRQNRCGSRISSRAAKLLEWPLCGVAERKIRCSKRSARPRTARVSLESTAYLELCAGAALWASSRMRSDPARSSSSQSRSGAAYASSRRSACERMKRLCVENGLTAYPRSRRRSVTKARSNTAKERPKRVSSSSRHWRTTEGGHATTTLRTFWRIRSSRRMRPASIVLPTPTSSAMNRFTRGRRSAFRRGSSW